MRIKKEEVIKRREIMLEKIANLIQEQLSTDLEISENTTFKDDLGADSLDIFELVMALEEQFGIEIPAEDLENVNTVGDVIQYLKDQGISE